MVTKVRINKEKKYKLSKWNAAEFNANFTLYVQEANFNSVAEDFASIETLEIYIDGMLVATYQSFDSYESISFVGKMYVEGERNFANTFAIALTKANLMDIVDRIEKSVSGEIDTDSMTVAQFKEYKKSQIRKEYDAHLAAGTHVAFEDNNSKLFSFTQMDQLEIMNMYSVTISGGSSIETVPYHGVQYSVANVKAIYTTMQKFIAAANIRLEIVNGLINAGTTKEDIEDYSFDVEFDTATQHEYDVLYGNALANIGLIGTAESEGMDEFLDIVYNGEE